MTSTTSTTLRRRRLAAAVLALPLTLAMTGTAFATGSSTAEARTPAAAALDSAPAAPDAAAAARKADDAKPTTGSAAGSAAGRSVVTATNSTYVNGNANSSKAERPNAPVAGPAPTQPLSKADTNGTGANPGATCTHSYCSNGTGLEPGNGNDSAPAQGQPCAGCVGKADNKNPKGQAPSGPVDRNAGYECDRNQGIGQSNPAHTGCTGTTTPPTTPPTGGGGGGGETPTCPDGSPMPPSGDIKDCNKKDDVKDDDKDVCPDMPGNQSSGPCDKKDDDVKDNGKITICHATGSATNPYELITISKNGLEGHGDHAGDIIPAPANGVCPGGTGGGGGTTPDNDKITICHATGSATNPYVVITIDRNGLNGHGDHAGDIIPMPAGGCPTAPTTVTDACPNLGGIQMPGTSCTPPTGGGGGGGTVPPVDVCPTVPGMQPMGPCVTQGGGGGTVPPAGGAPIGGVTPGQPAVGPVPVGPPTAVPPVIVPNGTNPTVLVGGATSPATRPAAARPRALPFTGTDAALLVELGALLLLAGGGVLVASRRERTARAA